MHIADFTWESAWLAGVDADAEFVCIARWTRLSFAIRIGDAQHAYRIVDGRLAVWAAAEGMPEIVFDGALAAWRDFLQPLPPRHAHHLLALDSRRPDFTIAAGRATFVRHLRVLNRAFELLRVAVMAVS